MRGLCENGRAREEERWTEIRRRMKQKGGGSRRRMGEPKRLTKRQTVGEESRKRIIRQR